MKKRLISLALVLALMVGICPAAFAAETESANTETIFTETQYSEFELYQNVIGHSDAELLEFGYTKSEIEAIRSFSMENAFLERGKLDYTELKAMGYMDEQIRLLKEYKGEPITPTSEILRAAAQCTGRMIGHSASSTAIYYSYTWEWSAMPINDLGDVVALSWVGIDPRANFVSVSCISKTGYLNYFSTATGKLHSQASLTLTPVSSLYGLSANITLKKVIPEEADGTMVVWAKQGNISVKLQIDAVGGSNSLSLIKSYGAVAHRTKKCSIGFSVGAPLSASFSFTPADSVSQVGVASYNLYADGRVVRQ